MYKYFIVLLKVLVFAVFIAGCSAVGPDYERPETVKPADWKYKDSVTISDSTAMAVADTSWWKLFGDTTLNNLITTGLKENTNIKLAAARVEQYMAYYGVSRAALYPEVNLNGSSTTGQFSSTNTGTDKNPTKSVFNLNISVGWELDLWGKIRRTNESARADLLASEESRQSMVLLITSQIASSYIDILTLRRQLEITKYTAEIREYAMMLFRLRFDKGEISNIQVSQLESEYWTAMSQIPYYENLIAQAENNLNLLIGKNPDVIPKGNVIDSLSIPKIPSGLPSKLLERRPDIRNAEQLLISANANIGAVKALYYPTISLSGVLGIASNDLTTILDPAALVWNLGGNIAAPLFNAGKISSKVKVSEAQKKQALFTYINAVRSAFRDVENALVNRSKTESQLYMQGKVVDSYLVYSKLSKMNFDEGVSSYIEVLDAERSLFSSQLQYVSTQGKLLKSYIDLYSAFAGGWVTKASQDAAMPEDNAEIKEVIQNK